MDEMINMKKVLHLHSKAFYREGYKYRLDKDLMVQTNIFPKETIRTEYMTLYGNGILKLRKSYAWDGATMCPDFEWIIRGSAVHDAGYQMIRMGLLKEETKDAWDNLLKLHCQEDIQALGKKFAKRFTPVIYWAVKRFGRKATLAESRRVVLVSP